MQILLFTQVLCAIILAGSFNTDAKPNGLRIINGDIAKEHEFPFIAYLSITKYWILEPELEKSEQTGVMPKYPQKTRYQCAGSIITEHHVLTAAHCVSSNAEEFWEDCRVREEDAQVFVGAHNRPKFIRNGRYRVDSSVQQLGVKLIQRHEKYLTHGDDYDIALLTLRERIHFSSYVARIALYPHVCEGLRTTIIGWGRTEDGDVSKKLRKHNTKTVDTPNKFLFRTNDPNGSSCFGDSGGPVVVDFEGTFLLAGVMSGVTEKNCRSGYPNIHVTAHSHLRWIRSAVKRSGMPGTMLALKRSSETERDSLS